jgi:hypothetical protein
MNTEALNVSDKDWAAMTPEQRVAVLGGEPKKVDNGLIGKHPFVYVMPTPESVETLSRLRGAMKDLHDAIIDMVPNSRERSIAITKLEECSMWVNKGIVFHQADPVPSSGSRPAMSANPEAAMELLRSALEAMGIGPQHIDEAIAVTMKTLRELHLQRHVKAFIVTPLSPP